MTDFYLKKYFESLSNFEPKKSFLNGLENFFSFVIIIFLYRLPTFGTLALTHLEISNTYTICLWIIFANYK